MTDTPTNLLQARETADKAKHSPESFLRVQADSIPPSIPIVLT